MTQQHHKFNPIGTPARKQWFFSEEDDYPLLRAHMRKQADRVCKELSTKTNLRVLEVGPSSAAYPESEETTTTAILGPTLKAMGHTYETMDLAGFADYLGNLENLAEAVDFQLFDVIIMLGVIEHVRRPWLLAEELYDSIVPGGCVYINTPFMFKLHGPSPDCWRISPEGFRSLFERHFSLEFDVFPEGEDGKNSFPLSINVKMTRGAR
jgi:SAM-dependent methyltransferase